MAASFSSFLSLSVCLYPSLSLSTPSPSPPPSLPVPELFPHLSSLSLLFSQTLPMLSPHLSFLSLNKHLFISLKKKKKKSFPWWHSGNEPDHEVAGLIPGLSQGVKDPCCPELWCRLQMRLWHRPAAIAPIWPLAWERPYAALKRKKKKNGSFHIFYF